MKGPPPSREVRAVLLLALLVLAMGLAGCAAFQAPAEEPAPATRGAMTQSRMEMLFADRVSAIDGPTGAIRTQVDGIDVYLLSDPARDRMRIVAPITMVDRVDGRVLGVLLQANFHHALDARYAISEGVIYSVFLHPISSLSPELLASALDQVVSLYKTFGTTFSSGPLRFGGGER